MNELEQYKERLRIVLGVEKVCVFEVDLPHQLYTFFENAEAIFGVGGDVILKDVRNLVKTKFPLDRLVNECYSTYRTKEEFCPVG